MWFNHVFQPGSSTIGFNHVVICGTAADSNVFAVCLGLKFIHSCYFYSASSNPLLLRGAPDTAWILCWSSTLKRHRQLRVKDLPVSTWRLEQDSNPRPFGRKVTNLPMSHHAVLYGIDYVVMLFSCRLLLSFLCFSRIFLLFI